MSSYHLNTNTLLTIIQHVIALVTTVCMTNGVYMPNWQLLATFIK